MFGETIAADLENLSMKQLAFFLSCFLIVSLTSCGLKPVVPTRITDVQFGKIDFLRGTIVMNMGLEINNPNNFAITIYGMDLNVKIDSVSLGAVSIEDKIKIQKDTQMVYRVNVQAKLTDVIHGIPTILNAISQKKSNASVDGWIRVGVIGIKKKFPVSIKQEAVQTGQE